MRIVDKREKKLCFPAAAAAHVDLIGDHGDKLAVGGLAPGRVDGVAEVVLQHLHISPVPRHLDGMADRPFHPGRGGLILFGNTGIELLGNGREDVLIGNDHQDRFPEIVVPP